MNGKFNINIDKLRSDMYEAGKEDREMFYPTDPLKQFPDRTPSELRSAASDALKKTQERYTNSYGNDYIKGLCGSNVDYWIIDQICEELDKRDAEIAKLRKGVEDWLQRMEYYSDNQYGKREMKELLK